MAVVIREYGPFTSAPHIINNTRMRYNDKDNHSEIQWQELHKKTMVYH